MAWSAGAILTATQLNTYDPQAWSSYTPALTGFLPGAGPTYSGRYIQYGKTVHFWAKCTIGTGFTAGIPSLSLPVTSAVAAGVLTGVFTDTGTTAYGAIPTLGGTTVALWVSGTNGQLTTVTSTVPFTWAAGDTIAVSGTYEAA